MPNRNKALFVTYGGGHVKSLLPVIREMIAANEVDIYVLALTTASHELEKHGINSLGFLDFSVPEDECDFYAGKILDEIPEGVVSREETIAYHGLCLKELIEDKGESQAIKLFSELGRQAFLPLNTLRKVFDTVQPDVVVATISPRAEKAALIVAKERGIPSVCLNDLFNTVSIERASSKGYGTKVAVISESVKAQLCELGRDKSEVVVTGNPAFDYLYDVRCHNKNPAEPRTLLWASQIEPDLNPFTLVSGDPLLPRKVEHALVEFVEKNSGWNLIIRPHPNERSQALKHHPRVKYSDSSESLADVLSKSDVVITLTSTVGLEARLLGIPVVTVDMSVFSDYTPFKRNGLSTGVKCLSEIDNAIVSASESHRCPPEGYPVPGQATHNMISLIESLLKGNI